MPAQPPSTNPLADFGANEWLGDELYQQYRRDKNSVDKAWWEFFADYRPNDGGTGKANGDGDGDGQADGDSNGAPANSGSAEQLIAEPPGTEPLIAEPASTEPKPFVPTPPVPAPVPPSPAAPAKPATKIPESPKASPKPRDIPPVKPTGPLSEDEVEQLRGAAARTVTNMEASLTVPTATSVRAIPAKLLIDNRVVINNHLRRSRGGKVSFTHLIGYALVKALSLTPQMNQGFGQKNGKAAIITPAHINLGLAIDLVKPDGSRILLVPAIKATEGMDFAHFWTAYEEVVRKARSSKLTVEDFQGTTISLTNPGGIGTVHSVPRLMSGQGAIIGVGALEYPAEWQGASQETLNRNAVSKIITITSTYDHRIIQGAVSGEFLRILHHLLLGEHNFYGEIFESLRIPYQPIDWVQDISTTHDSDINKTARVQQLIHAYRVRGHLMADTDPLEYRQRRHPDLDVSTHGLTLWDLERDFATGGFGGAPLLKLRKILGILRDAYCRTVGVEYMHIQDPGQRQWIQSKVETPYAKASPDEQLRILRRLNSAEAFETFLQTKFVGQKRFSLEGGESVIAVLDRILCRAVAESLEEVCIGMSHRGRLNVLANIAGKSYNQIFREFEGTQDLTSVQGSGDVKYHLGTEGTFVSEDGAKTRVYLAANPSHLEAVNPVLEGIVRAKQDRLDLKGAAYTVLPLLLHGDAAFAGQGVVAETLNLSQLRGYRTGGTIHVIINNQVGFTTSPSASRSTVYSTDVARMIQAPIFHVNGDDPEACVRVAELAYDFRQKFNKDVVIDMICYRRRGHNEGDDPSMTQPLMYSLIEAKRSVRKLYTESLIGRGDISIDDAEEALRDYRKRLEQVFLETKDTKGGQVVDSADQANRAGHAGHAGEVPDTDTEGHGGLERPSAQEVDEHTPHPFMSTALSVENIQHLGDAFVNKPEGFTLHPKLAQLMQKRAAMVREGGIDWAMAELLAFGSLLREGVPVRLSGQDSRRGTFAQRHAVLIDKVTAQEWSPLQHLDHDQASFWIYDSLLSEFAAMGFEYGYSVERPDALVLWEAQFGDFAGGAQTIIDEFICSSQQKWGQRSSVVLLLPHGYEGQGPDHSSARIERFLQLCAEDNMKVTYPSTPASYFHLLRRQAYRRPRRPLIVFTPKSMLRLKAASSAVEDFTSGSFRTVLPDPANLPANAVTRVLLASGKVIYDLEAERARRGDTSTAILRIEQLAPLPADEILASVKAYPKAEIMWVQDEPANLGAWSFMAMNLPQALAGRGETRPLQVASRVASASPATGSSKKHALQQAQLMSAAFDR